MLYSLFDLRSIANGMEVARLALAIISKGHTSRGPTCPTSSQPCFLLVRAALSSHGFQFCQQLRPALTLITGGKLPIRRTLERTGERFLQIVPTVRIREFSIQGAPDVYPLRKARHRTRQVASVFLGIRDPLERQAVERRPTPVFRLIDVFSAAF